MAIRAEAALGLAISTERSASVDPRVENMIAVLYILYDEILPISAARSNSDVGPLKLRWLFTLAVSCVPRLQCNDDDLAAL